MYLFFMFQTILDAILPYYLEDIKNKTNKLDSPSAAREEIATLSHVAVSMRALVASCEPLTRYMSYSDYIVWSE